MTDATTQTHKNGNGLGRLFFWLAMLLALAFLSFVTATAVRNNPIYSDREANGISKYKFIDECRELAGEGEKLSISAMGQSISLKELVTQSSPLKAGETIHTALEAESKQIVSSTNTVEGGGWSLTAPVTVSIVKDSAKRTLGQLPMQCAYNKKEGKTTASLQLPGQ